MFIAFYTFFFQKPPVLNPCVFSLFHLNFVIFWHCLVKIRDFLGGPLLDPFLEVILGAFWSVVGSPWEPLGTSWGAPWPPLGHLGDPLGLPWPPLGSFKGAFGCLLGPFGSLRELLGAFLVAFGSL